MSAWALKKDDQLARISLSEDHAQDLVVRRAYTIQPANIEVGQALNPGEVSPTGIYALIDRRKKRILRVTLDYEAAQLLCARGERLLAQATLTGS